MPRVKQVKKRQAKRQNTKVARKPAIKKKADHERGAAPIPDNNPSWMIFEHKTKHLNEIQMKQLSERIEAVVNEYMQNTQNN